MLSALRASAGDSFFDHIHSTQRSFKIPGKTSRPKNRSVMSSPYAHPSRNQRGGASATTADIDSIWNDLLNGITEIYQFKRKMCTTKYMTLYT